MALDLGVCFSTGYGYSQAKRKEDEVKQGKSYYQAANYQIAQIYSLSSTVEILADRIADPSLQLTAKVINQAIPILSVAVCPFSAVVKQGHYEVTVQTLNSFTKPYTPLVSYLMPTTLGRRSTAVFSFLAEHTGDIAQMAMLATTVALPIFTSPYCAGALLAPIAYNVVDASGFIPRKASLFVESYMPLLSNIILFAGGSLLNKVVSVANGVFYFSEYSHKVHRTIDHYNQDFSAYKGIKLEEIDKPLVVRKELTFKEINVILDGSDAEYEINPAHLSKGVDFFKDLSMCFDFDYLKALFASIDWQKRFSVIKPYFKDDERFIDGLRAIFPDKEDVLKEFDSLIDEWSKKQNVTKEKLLSDLLHSQMEEFIKILKGEKRVKGSQQELNEALSNIAKIISFLKTLDPTKPSDKIEIEDILLKLMIEGGEYCARAIKRASCEILHQIIQKAFSKEMSIDPEKNFELQLKFSLEQFRRRIMHSVYQKYFEITVNILDKDALRKISFDKQTTDKAAVAMAQDIHMYDVYQKYFALGFIPISDAERSSFGTYDIFMWGSSFYPFKFMRAIMYGQYEANLHSIIKEIGEVNFGNYMRAILLKNKNLTAAEAEAILEKFTSSNDGEWEPEECIHKFHRLMFVMQGVMRMKAISGDWMEVEDDEVDDKEADDTPEVADEDGWVKVDNS